MVLGGENWNIFKNISLCDLLYISSRLHSLLCGAHQKTEISVKTFIYVTANWHKLLLSLLLGCNFFFFFHYLKRKLLFYFIFFRAIKFMNLNLFWPGAVKNFKKKLITIHISKSFHVKHIQKEFPLLFYFSFRFFAFFSLPCDFTNIYYSVFHST